MTLSAFENALLGLAPYALFQLDDATGPAASDLTGFLAGAYGGSFALHQPSISPGGDFSATFSGGSMTLNFAPAGFPAPTTMWMALTSLTQAADGWIFRVGTPGVDGYGFFVPAGTSQQVTFGTPAANILTGYTIPDTLPHWFAFFTATSGANLMYVDGVQRASFSSGAPAPPTAGYGFASAHNGSSPLHCTMEDIALFNYGLTSQQIASLYGIAVPGAPIVPVGGFQDINTLLQYVSHTYQNSP